MTNDDVDKVEANRRLLKAKILSKMDRKGFYDPRDVRVENLPSIVPCRSDQEGQVKGLAHEMARDDSEPVVYGVTGDTVMLEVDSTEWVIARIRFHDASALVPGQGDDLRIVDND